ncbi:MAG: YicC/YloC family endoribonuclease [Gammaproteobacteria bacterium]|uniref:YicC family protein n=1 Tax=SAR86 cluster bacterium TaxID=2030880 RepID=A0A520MQ16_9GAMM|nr:MAG: YicC family protein [SAR86 cluster bacterium]
MIKSMTGFGSSTYSFKDAEIYCEIKTVNHRFLEISTKPNDLNNSIDLYVRDTLTKKLKRGSIDVRFRFKTQSGNSYSVNTDSVKNLLKSIKDIPNINSNNINFSDIKDLPGVIKSEKGKGAEDSLIKRTFNNCLKQLIESRELEGLKIKKVFLSKIKKISQNALRISSSNKKYTKKRFINLKKKISDLTNNIDSNKFEHEVAMLVLKHDVAEEIERIKFHCSSLQKEITSNKTSGKKIDFMLQELFRETSTLSVKLDEPNYKKIALDMKLLVEEMREQAQNIE